MNVNGLKSKVESVGVILEEIQPDVCVLQESKVSEAARSISFHGYHVFQRPRSGKQGGGIMTLVANKWRGVTSVVATGTKAEFISVRFEIGKPALCITNMYGGQDSDRLDLIQSRWEEVRQALEEQEQAGNSVILVGDMNTWMGEHSETNPHGIVGNPNKKTSPGAVLLSNWLEGGRVLVNNIGLTTGGPGTHIETQSRGTESVLTLMAVSEEVANRVIEMKIDDEKNFTARSVATKSRPAAFADHKAVLVRFRDLNLRWKRKKSSSWILDPPGFLNYRDNTKEEATNLATLANKISQGEVDVEDAWKEFEKMEKKIMYKSFIKVTKSVGGRKEKCREEVEEEKMKNEVLMRRKIKRIQSIMEKVEPGQAVPKGQNVWKLAKGLMKERKETQPAAAVKNTVSGRMVWDEAEVKETVWQHVVTTLSDNPPADAHAAAVKAAQKSLHEFRLEEDRGESVEVPKEVFDKVLKKMELKGKRCYDMLAKADKEWKEAIFLVLRAMFKVGKFPTAFGKTILSQLYKGKGSRADLSSYRYIHLKSSIPRLAESIICRYMDQSSKQVLELSFYLSG